MKLVPFSTIFVTGLMVFGCAPADPAGADGTGGKPAGSGGSLATGGTNASGGTTGSGGATSSGGATNTGGATGTGGAIAGTGGNSSSGGAPGSGGAATGSGGRGGGGRMGMGMGTGGGPTGGGSGSGTSFAAVATILGSSCGTGMCHQPAGPHVDLTNNAGLRTRLVGGMPNGTMTMAMCKTKTLVVAGDPATSVISQVIKGKVMGCTNARMPDNCPSAMRPCLTMAQIATIDGWIMGGAGP